MMTLLGSMPFWGWFVIAGGFLLGEVLTGALILLWPAVTAVLIGLLALALPPGAWVIEWLAFAGLSIALGVACRPWLERRINRRAADQPLLNEFGAQTIGARGAVAGTFIAGQGRVRLGDTEWSARADVPLTDGQPVEVTGVDGPVLRVAPIPGA